LFRGIKKIFSQHPTNFLGQSDLIFFQSAVGFIDRSKEYRSSAGLGCFTLILGHKLYILLKTLLWLWNVSTCNKNICGTSTEYESDEDDEPLLEAKSKTHHTYETLLDLLKEAREFALVEDDTYLDPVQNLITITEKNIVQQKLSRKRHQSNLDNFVEQI